MSTSQNGWPASSDPSKIDIVKPSVSGVDFPQGVKDGDVKTVLMYVAAQFHKHVETLHDGWCWGYAYRPIEGSDQLSNHSSGTAIDINAPRHPMGVHGTFSSTQVENIHAILKFCEGAVRWGGDYSGRKDEMHFEINANAEVVARIAKKIKDASAPKPPAPVPAPSTVLKVGSEGTAVTHVQVFFRDVFPIYRFSVDVKPGVMISTDGVFGLQTEAWVKEFQKRTDLDDDGVVGSLTLKKMREFGYKY